MAVNTKCDCCGRDAFRQYVEVIGPDDSVSRWITLIECMHCGTHATNDADQQAFDRLKQASKRTWLRPLMLIGPLALLQL